MTPTTKTSLSRKIVLGLGAAVISGMALTSTAEAKPKFSIDIHFGHGWHGYHGPCGWYLKKYFHTGKWHWKKKYKKCMWYYYH